MGSVILAVNGINKILDSLNLGLPAGIRLYRTLKELTAGTADPLPDLPDSAVIALLKQRSEDGIDWTESELQRVEELIKNEKGTE